MQERRSVKKQKDEKERTFIFMIYLNLRCLNEGLAKKKKKITLTEVFASVVRCISKIKTLLSSLVFQCNEYYFQCGMLH